jgi:hypothetical protein
MQQDRTYIYHHLGLGDHIICNGLVRKIVEGSGNYFLFSKTHNKPSVEFMFRDLKNLKVVDVKDDYEIPNVLKLKPGKLIKIGHENLNFVKNFNKCTWDEAFYLQLGIPFNERWDSFYFQPDQEKEDNLFKKLNPNNEPFCLIHNKDSNGIDRIDYTKVNQDLLKIFVEKSETILDYRKLINLASEIHCIDSSFKHLVESLETSGILFYHRNFNFRNTSSEEHKTKKNWIEI